MHLLKSLFYALAAFLAACSVHFGEGGAVLIQLPPLSVWLSHPDLYAAGLLTLVEVFSRLTPTPNNIAFSSFLTRLLDSVLANRSDCGGRFTTHSVLNAPAA